MYIMSHYCSMLLRGVSTCHRHLLLFPNFSMARFVSGGIGITSSGWHTSKRVVLGSVPLQTFLQTLDNMSTVRYTEGMLSVSSPPALTREKINVPTDRLLMGPGPSNMDSRVCQASSLPMLGHMHPEVFKIMDDIKAGLKYVFQTENEWTILVSGAGHLAMESIFVNLLEPGETVLIGVNGIWGLRASDLGNRLGANVVKLEAEPGTTFTLAQIEEGLAKHRPKLLFLIHSESSAGVMQNVEGVGDLCRKYDCLLAVDTVASLGGVPFFMDKWKVDAVYTGSQKVLGCSPGLAPISYGPRAMEKIQNRKSPIKSFFLDMTLLSVYWGCNGKDVPRTYHHTPPISLFYAMREALSMLVEEGLPASWERHAKANRQLRDGVKALGLEPFVEKEGDRLPTIMTLKVPPGMDWKGVNAHAMQKYNVEIAGGLGPTLGKVFRIGIMGTNATPERVDRVLSALKESINYVNAKNESNQSKY